MLLAGLLGAGEDAFLCDMAEFYGILEPRAQPVRRLAALAAGLPARARCRLALAGEKADPALLLLASIADRLGFLCWAQTRDGQRGKNRPPSVLAALLGAEGPAKPLPRQGQPDGPLAYENGAAFEAARQSILNRKGGQEYGN